MTLSGQSADATVSLSATAWPRSLPRSHRGEGKRGVPTKITAEKCQSAPCREMLRVSTTRVRESDSRAARMLPLSILASIEDSHSKEHKELGPGALPNAPGNTDHPPEPRSRRRSRDRKQTQGEQEEQTLRDELAQARRAILESATRPHWLSPALPLVLTRAFSRQADHERDARAGARSKREAPEFRKRGTGRASGSRCRICVASTKGAFAFVRSSLHIALSPRIPSRVSDLSC